MKFPFIAHLCLIPLLGKTNALVLESLVLKNGSLRDEHRALKSHLKLETLTQRHQHMGGLKVAEWPNEGNENEDG